MGTLINLLNAQAKLYDGPPRQMDPAFGVTYFDGTREQGCGGYKYIAGYWKPVCEAILKRYGLSSSSRVLDLGCAKGFFMADLKEACPGMRVEGIEISEYAREHALDSMKPLIHLGSAEDLSRYPDHSFDFVAAMNVIHFLTPKGAERSLQEIMRVGKPGKYFVQVDAFTNPVERERLLAWAPIIKTVYSVDQWLDLFKKAGYDGDYFWTFVRPLTEAKFASNAASSL